MTFRATLASLAAVLALPLLASCGGGNSSISMTSATAASARYSQIMSVTFTGQGLDQGVEARVTGPCEALASGSRNATGATFTCVVTGLGDIVMHLVQTDGQVGLGNLRVTIPAPRVAMTLTDGDRSGVITLEIDPTAAPFTAARFMLYANSAGYTSTTIHRVSPTSAILGGGYTVNADGVLVERKHSQPDLVVERSTLSNLRGTIAMYREPGVKAPNAMFFINTVDNPQFDKGGSDGLGYTVFGRVVEGFNVLDEVASVPVRESPVLGVADAPVTAIRISAVTQVR